MRYLMLIYSDEAREAQRSEAESQAVMGDYYAFSAEARQREAYVTGEALQPTTTATTVRVRNSQLLTTDGPFAETKEQLGGFYLLNCQDLDEAIELAGKIPGARSGSIEIRPIMEFN